MFGYMTLLSGQGLARHFPPLNTCELHPHNNNNPPPPYCITLPPPSHHHHHHLQEEDQGEEETSPGVSTEFYPVDPLSRGMIDRLYVLNRWLDNYQSMLFLITL